MTPTADERTHEIRPAAMKPRVPGSWVGLQDVLGSVLAKLESSSVARYPESVYRTRTSKYTRWQPEEATPVLTDRRPPRAKTRTTGIAAPPRIGPGRVVLKGRQTASCFPLPSAPTWCNERIIRPSGRPHSHSHTRSRQSDIVSKHSRKCLRCRMMRTSRGRTGP